MFNGQQVNDLKCFLAGEQWSRDWAKDDAQFFLERLGKKPSDKMEFIFVDEGEGNRIIQGRIFGTLEEAWPLIEQVTLQLVSVFFRLNDYCEGKKKNRGNLKKINAVVVEGRSSSPALLEQQPNLMIEAAKEITSFYLLNDEDSQKFNEAEELSLAISKKIGSFKQSANPNQIFRLAGTISWKFDKPSYVQDIAGSPNRFFSLHELKDLFQISELGK